MKASSVKTDWKAPSTAGWQGGWARLQRWKLSHSAAVQCCVICWQSIVSSFSILTVMPSWLLSVFTFTCILVDSVWAHCLWTFVVLCYTVCRYAGGFPVFVLSLFLWFFFFPFFSLYCWLTSRIKVQCSDGGLSVWSLIIPSVPAWLLPVHSSFPTRCEDNIVRLTCDFKSSWRCGCERACLSLCIRPAIAWQLLQGLPTQASPYDTRHRLQPQLSAGQAVMENGWMDVLTPSGFHILTFLERFSALSATHQCLFLYWVDVDDAVRLCFYACLDVWLHAFWAVWMLVCVCVCGEILISYMKRRSDHQYVAFNKAELCLQCELIQSPVWGSWCIDLNSDK